MPWTEEIYKAQVMANANHCLQYLAPEQSTRRNSLYDDSIERRMSGVRIYFLRRGFWVIMSGWSVKIWRGFPLEKSRVRINCRWPMWVLKVAKHSIRMGGGTDSIIGKGNRYMSYVGYREYCVVCIGFLAESAFELSHYGCPVYPEARRNRDIMREKMRLNL